MLTFWKKNGKMYGHLPWYYYFVTTIIKIIIINLNILGIDVFSPAGNQHQVYPFYYYYYYYPPPPPPTPAKKKK